MKLYTVVVYNLWMYIKEDTPGLKTIKGDKLSEIINCNCNCKFWVSTLIKCDLVGVSRPESS